MTSSDAAGESVRSEFWLRTLLRWYVGLVIRPGATVREIVERRPFWAGAIAACIGSYLWLFLWNVYTGSGGLSHSLEPSGGFPTNVGGLIVIVIISFIAVISIGVLAVVFHLVASLMRGWGELSAMYVGLLNLSAVAVMTGILAIAIAALLEVAGVSLAFSTGPRILTAIGVAPTAWTIFLTYYIIRANYELGPIRSGVALLVGLAALPIALTVALALLVIALLIGMGSV